MRGRAIKLSVPRRLVCDLMRFSIGVPRVTVQRQMNLDPLQRANRPDQQAVLDRAVLEGIRASLSGDARVPACIRQAPRPQLYEYPESVASIAHEREHDGERVVLLSKIKSPERLPIPELAALIDAVRSRPVAEIKEFRRALKIARMPGPIRWLLMWLGLNLGSRRAHYFGTFQLSVYSGLGAESLNPLTPLTTLFNYGPIAADGTVTVRIHYDHRVMDGANVARALERFEAILNGDVAQEVLGLSQDEAVHTPLLSRKTT